MGWHFKWVSSFGSDFNFDYHVSFAPEEKAGGKVDYNYVKQQFPSDEAPGLSVFYRDPTSGEIFHTYSTRSTPAGSIRCSAPTRCSTWSPRDATKINSPSAWRGSDTTTATERTCSSTQPDPTGRKGLRWPRRRPLAAGADRGVCEGLRTRKGGNAMQYLLLCCIDEALWTNLPEVQRDGIMNEYGKLVQELKKNGQLLAGAKLDNLASAVTVREKNGKSLVTDGPFAETKEQLGGYHLFECQDRDEAIAIAKRIPALAVGGSIEVRPVLFTE
jgi:hypothetical protein